MALRERALCLLSSGPISCPFPTPMLAAAPGISASFISAPSTCAPFWQVPHLLGALHLLPVCHGKSIRVVLRRHGKARDCQTVSESSLHRQVIDVFRWAGWPWPLRCKAQLIPSPPQALPPAHLVALSRRSQKSFLTPTTSAHSTPTPTSLPAHLLLAHPAHHTTRGRPHLQREVEHRVRERTRQDEPGEHGHQQQLRAVAQRSQRLVLVGQRLALAAAVQVGWVG